MVNSKFNFFTILVVVLLTTSCNNRSLTGILPLSIDKTLGEQASSTITYQFANAKVLDSLKYHQAYLRLYKIKDRILKSGQVKHAKDFNWQLTIMHDDSMLNAFCLPGGKIYVFTGIIKYLETEDALAGVMAHEIAHADCRHGTAQLVKNLGLSLIIKLIFGVDNGGLIDMGANLLSLGFSRADESEADEKSVEYLNQTEYDSRGAAKFFEKMIADKKDAAVFEILSTHPDAANRVKNIHQQWEKMGSKEGQTFKKEYTHLKQLIP